MKARDWETVNEIIRRGRIWLEQPFPDGYRGHETEGVDLVLLDTFAAGCITSFVSSRGRIAFDHITVLKECLRQLDSILPWVGVEARMYFHELREITNLIVNLRNR